MSVVIDDVFISVVSQDDTRIVVQTNTVIQTASIGAVGPQGIPGPQGPPGASGSGNLYKVGTSVSDADYQQTPSNGTIAVSYDSNTGKVLIWTRANAVWRSVEAT